MSELTRALGQKAAPPPRSWLCSRSRAQLLNVHHLSFRWRRQPLRLERGEAAAVCGTRAVLGNSSHVLCGGVPFVIGPAILRPLCVKDMHEPIPRHLGEDGGGRDAVHLGIAPLDRLHLQRDGWRRGWKLEVNILDAFLPGRKGAVDEREGLLGLRLLQHEAAQPRYYLPTILKHLAKCLVIHRLVDLVRVTWLKKSML